MAIKNNLSILMGRERYSIADVHKQTGLSRNTISGFYNDTAKRIDYATIEKLCGLFNCDVGDLLILGKLSADRQTINH